MDGDGVAVRVGEGEGEAERPGRRRGEDGRSPAGELVVELLGYVLKQAASALRGAMDEVLRPLELTVSQYATLEVLAQRPGLSGADLARATFVSRQSANLVLQGLERRGLLSRADVAPHGRALPVELTVSGHEVLRSASAAVRGVERRMLAQLSTSAQRRLMHDLTTCVEALATSPDDEQPAGPRRRRVHPGVEDREQHDPEHQADGRRAADPERRLTLPHAPPSVIPEPGGRGRAVG